MNSRWKQPALTPASVRPQAKSYQMGELEIVLFPSSETDEKGNPRTASYPSLTGKTVIGGQQYSVALWQEHPKRDQAKVYFKGAIRLPYRSQSESGQPS